MISLPGYLITEKISEGMHSFIYRGYREIDHLRVIIKALKSEYAFPEEVAYFNHECELLQSLQGNGTVNVIGVEHFENTLFLVTKEFGTSSLKAFIEKRTLNPRQFLVMALSITEALEKIHSHNIIHKDLNPNNILWDEAAQQAKIIDFGAATTLPREVTEIIDPSLLQGGTLYYISPEQTGRMNRGIDYRTDYYSLGVTFYQMITGMLPFQSDDLSEIIHAHIAKLPMPPHEINPAIPETVSNIIMKLMAKTVEERYQSTYGLKEDLLACLNQWQRTGTIIPFTIGEKDISSHFQIPEKLYGRENELNLLLETFHRASVNQAELFVVKGYPGIGKSALVHELYKSLVENKGHFITGKFDPFKRNMPYFAIVQAIQEMVQQILVEGSNTQIDIWRDRIQKAVGINGQVALDLVPSLSAIIGEQPPVPILSATEAQHRFHAVMQHLIQALAGESHPLVIFLDDCQWADVSSIQLIEYLIPHHSSRHFLFILTFRENEVSQDHILTHALNRLSKMGIQFQTVALVPLQLKHVTQLLSETLHRTQNEVKALAEICLQKTNGNPFFLNQFLKNLYKEALIEFSIEEGKWTWWLDDIRDQQMTDNVIELMSNKIKELPKKTQEILQIAACLGSHFDLQTLALTCQLTLKDTAQYLWEALQAGLVLAKDTGYLSALFSTSEIKRNAYFSFLHDHVQNAAYSLIDITKRSEIHLKIGRLLWQHTPKEKMYDAILDIVNQINLAPYLLTDQQEKQAVAELNLMAGKKALDSIAYKSSLDYFKTGIALLEKDRWQNQYDLALALHNGAIEAAYLAAEPDEMKKYSQVAIDNIKDTLEKMKIYETQLHYLANEHKFIEAAKLGSEVLNLLGVSFTDHPNYRHIFTKLIQARWLMLGKSTKDLEKLPIMTDPYYLAAMRILTQMGYVAYFIDRKLTVLVILNVIILSIKHGNCAESAAAYLGWAFMQCHVFNHFETGRQFAQFALRLADKFGSNKVIIQLGYLYPHTIMHWFEHVDKTLSMFMDIYYKAIDTGNIEYAGYCIVDYAYRSFLSGKELNNLSKDIDLYAKSLASLGLNWSHLNVMSTLQIILNLLSAKQEIEFNGPAFDEKKSLPILINEKDNIGIFAIYHNKLFLCYLFHDYDKAYQYLLEAQKYDDKMKSRGHFAVPAFCFITSLIYLARYHSANKKEKRQLLKHVKKNQALMKRWSQYAPMNFSQKYYLVKAELEHITGDFKQAEKDFDRAIKLAKENRYLHEEAIANELAALFYAAQGREKIARTYMTDAYYCYAKWGATAKIAHIEKYYTHLLTHKLKYSEKFATIPLDQSPSPLAPAVTATIDLASIMKSTRTIISEMILEDLLKKMMRIVIENAGAQKGFLILEKGGNWFIEAESSIQNENVTVLQSKPIEDILPTSVIHYVIYKRKPLALGDAIHAELFSSDHYIQHAQPKSILCVPLINQGVLRGILYMENNLTTQAFTANRIEMINLLSGQIIIAIDNARLYSHLQALNLAYESFVPKEFLNLLEKKSILDVKLGDQVQKEMTVMFCDIRGFSTFSEGLTPKETLSFINNFLKLMEPIIRLHNGIIDKYIGDAIMALFPQHADDALHCAIAMQKALGQYNKERQLKQLALIKVGIGLNTGLLVLGTVGDPHRMEGTVISDAVNIASRVESLNKTYHTHIIITDDTYTKLKYADSYAIRMLDHVIVKGKSKPITIYEVFDNDTEESIIAKKKYHFLFSKGVQLLKESKFHDALPIFREIITLNPQDETASFFADYCEKKLHSPKIKI